MNKKLLNKIFTLSLILGAMCLSAFSQNEKKTVDEKFVSAKDAAKNALNVGAKIPSFSLKDATGKTVSSDDLLKDGNLVLVFYRGAWCPYCNTYLRKLQKNLPQIKAAGGQLVAISVENADKSSTIVKKNELEYTVLSDSGLTVARSFGIVYEMPKETSELYKSKGFDLAKYNNLEKAELPLSATYVINRQGEIVYAFLEPDYTKRAEPKEILETLSKIKPAAENKN